MTTKNDGVWARKLMALGVWAIALGVWAIVGVAIFLNVDLGPYLLEVGVAVIAISAVMVSLSQALITRRYAKLSVKPLLHFSYNVHKPNAMILHNGGLGSAIVMELRVAVDDNPLEVVSKTQWDNVMEELKVDLFDGILVDESFVIPPSSSTPMITGLNSAQMQFVTKVDEDIGQKRLHMEATYKSAYGKLFKESITLEKTPPQTIDK